MDDLIYRQAAIDVLHDYFDGMLETDTVCPKDIYNLFEIIPSAQPEIIRCRDCIHDHDHDCPVDWGRTDDDYCSWAERRTDE